MRTESLGASYLALPDGPAPYPGVVVIHEASGLNDNIRGICRRFAAEGYAALGVDLFEGRNRAACMARMFIGGIGRKPQLLRRSRPEGRARAAGRASRGGR
jgi:carboxymethylenebutenolidase